MNMINIFLSVYSQLIIATFLNIKYNISSWQFLFSHPSINTQFILVAYSYLSNLAANKLQKIILIMQDYQTFSLTTILNTHQLQPEVYQHMIHQIKSPLQQQSFDMTNDNSLTLSRVPKRPNIPPPPLKSPLAQPNNQQFCKHHQSIKKTRDVVRDNVMESFVSPLQYSINPIQQPNFWQCGQLLDSLLQSKFQIQVQVPRRTTVFKRKPIFEKIKLNRPHKTLLQAVLTLQKVDQPEIAFFIKLMGALENQLVQITKDKIQMERDLSIIFQRLSAQTEYTPRSTQVNDAHQKILRRLRTRNAGQALKKVFNKSSNYQQIGQRHLQTLFSRLNKIEIIINEFIKQKQALENLSAAYQFIQYNFGYQHTFKSQLYRLYQSLSIELSTDGLELIWQQCGTRVLKKNEFIQRLTMNDYVIRSQEGFQQDLSSKGFKRNE